MHETTGEEAGFTNNNSMTFPLYFTDLGDGRFRVHTDSGYEVELPRGSRFYVEIAHSDQKIRVGDYLDDSGNPKNRQELTRIVTKYKRGRVVEGRRYIERKNTSSKSLPRDMDDKEEKRREVEQDQKISRAKWLYLEQRRKVYEKLKDDPEKMRQVRSERMRKAISAPNVQRKTRETVRKKREKDDEK